MLTKKTYEIPLSLTHNAGQIEAEFSAATYNVSLSGLTANTLYFLYTRKVSNVASLVYTTTVPSTYRVSFPDAVLVGAFYSNGLASVGFGSFVDIENQVETQDWISAAVTGSYTTNTTYTCLWKRSGQDILLDILISFSGTPTPSVAASVNLPSNLTTAPFFSPNIGVGSFLDQPNTYYGLEIFAIVNGSAPVIEQAGSTHVVFANFLPNSPVVVATGDRIEYSAKLKINEFLDVTPLKDR